MVVDSTIFICVKQFETFLYFLLLLVIQFSFLSPSLIGEVYNVLTAGPFLVHISVSSINKQYLNLLSSRAETLKSSHFALRTAYPE